MRERSPVLRPNGRVIDPSTLSRPFVNTKFANFERREVNSRTIKACARDTNAKLMEIKGNEHDAVPVKNYLKPLNWGVLPHQPYSPNIVPSDYHLFRSMAHALSEQRFTSYEDTKNWVDSWISSKDKEFFRLGIRTLPVGWEKVVASDGQYFD
ncbi:Mariner Mos1 transposase [Eumeta japonica]|uniref:Mariner Mos1 transposase n=1 Tax=Eumeta variegata TaxID=151549 RepID=A0A4C1URJ2_EUMVA|nr:Mariner Mos1 transposase [Eumeta japonica]